MLTSIVGEMEKFHAYNCSVEAHLTFLFCEWLPILRGAIGWVEAFELLSTEGLNPVL
jgi:hypothetical protein